MCLSVRVSVCLQLVKVKQEHGLRVAEIDRVRREIVAANKKNAQKMQEVFKRKALIEETREKCKDVVYQMQRYGADWTFEPDRFRLQASDALHDIECT